MSEYYPGIHSLVIQSLEDENIILNATQFWIGAKINALLDHFAWPNGDFLGEQMPFCYPLIWLYAFKGGYCIMISVT